MRRQQRGARLGRQITVALIGFHRSVEKIGQPRRRSRFARLPEFGHAAPPIQLGHQLQRRQGQAGAGGQDQRRRPGQGLGRWRQGQGCAPERGEHLERSAGIGAYGADAEQFVAGKGLGGDFQRLTHPRFRRRQSRIGRGVPVDSAGAAGLGQTRDFGFAAPPRQGDGVAQGGQGLMQPPARCPAQGAAILVVVAKGQHHRALLGGVIERRVVGQAQVAAQPDQDGGIGHDGFSSRARGRVTMRPLTSIRAWNGRRNSDRKAVLITSVPPPVGPKAGRASRRPSMTKAGQTWPS